MILEQLTDMESAVKLGELADRLSGAGIGLATVRSLLASNPDRFAYHERKWIPASRLLGQGRPFAEAMAVVLHGFGGPMPMSVLVTEIGRIRQLPAEEVEPTVRRIAKYDWPFVVTGDDHVSLTQWGFEAIDQKLDRALALNGITREEFDGAQAKLANINFRDPAAIADAVRIAAPIRLKVLGAVAYAALNRPDPKTVLMFDARQFYADAISVPGYVFAPDGVLYPEADAKKWISNAIRLAERLAPTVEVEDVQPIEVKPEDVDKLVAKVLANENTTTATRLLEENYEITLSNKTFPDDMANIMAALRGQDQLQWVGGDRFRRKGDFPEYILEVPEPFQFTKSDQTSEEGDPIDVELTDDGLSSSLRKLLQHPLATDVLDEDIQPAPKTMPEQVRLVLKSIHRELGTFPMAQIPTGWLSAEPKIQEIIAYDPTGRELQIWANHDARLLYGFLDWWYEQPVESGAVFTLTKTNKANVLEFEWLDQPDPVVYISAQRMEELRQLGVTSEGKSTLDLLIEVMAHWPKGADYLTILAEINVVRRSSRRLIASLLSSYQCFYQRSGSPVWHFDAKKVELGFDKTKRKFVKK
ncbi:hypothetical protein [Fimbriimonas ginsengisoli]|uniref:hypothetical protein n=1 Tax=Fimbriimonas ginsengisoli TaxID=1005039 RepID=UPI0011869AB6|nr:hypothetical protein [Fimbriimonas ginsengisoli]